MENKYDRYRKRIMSITNEEVRENVFQLIFLLGELVNKGILPRSLPNLNRVLQQHYPEIYLASLSVETWIISGRQEEISGHFLPIAVCQLRRLNKNVER